MSMEWYRAYHNMPHDPKLQVVARRSKQPMAFVVAVWVCILDAASQHDPRGIIEIDPEEVAVIQGIDLEAVEAILDALKSKNLIDDDGNVVNWHKRQHTTSTERSKKSRDKKKQGAAGSSGTQAPTQTAQLHHSRFSGCLGRCHQAHGTSSRPGCDPELVFQHCHHRRRRYARWRDAHSRMPPRIRARLDRKKLPHRFESLLG